MRLIQHSLRGLCTASSTTATATAGVTTEVVLALGSNVGDRAGNMHRAVRELRHRGVLEVGSLVTSSMYETAPLYVTDQPKFLNAAVRGLTRHSPRELLRSVKSIEVDLGRNLHGGVRYGPRPIDVDIIFYGNGAVKLPELDDAPGGGAVEIPHPRYRERGFVLAPLDDLLPWPARQGSRPPMPTRAALGLKDDVHVKSTGDNLGYCRGITERLVEARAAYELGGFAASPDLRRVFALPQPDRRSDALVWPLGKQTYIMGILNVTPDSFSDGGKHAAASSAVSRAHAMASEGADFIDIGGQSTRPGSTPLGADEEWDRIAPVLEELAQNPPLLPEDHACHPGKAVPISVDTFHSTVARRAASFGCAMLNDVSGGVPWAMRTSPEDGEDALPSFDESPASVAGTSDDVPLAYAIMHMRGTPATMQNDDLTRYPCNDVAGGVGDELAVLCANAMQTHGIEPWRFLLDPGIGFAKTAEGNWDIIKRLPHIRERLTYGAIRNAPFLLGPSRKGFLGQLTGRPAPERDIATAAAIVACVQAGADIVRVHNVGAARDAVLVADRVWR